MRDPRENIQVLVKVEGWWADDLFVKRSARCLLSVVATMLAVMLVVESGAVSAAPAPATVYTVANGDSLVGIAGSFGIKVSTLLRANDLTLASVIHPGDVLTVPAVAPTSGTADTTPPKAVAAAPTTAMTNYQVRSGDALAGIARANGVTLGALVKVERPGDDQRDPRRPDAPTAVADEADPRTREPARYDRRADCRGGGHPAGTERNGRRRVGLCPSAGRPAVPVLRRRSRRVRLLGSRGRGASAQAGFSLPHQSLALSKVGSRRRLDDRSDPARRPRLHGVDREPDRHQPRGHRHRRHDLDPGRGCRTGRLDRPHAGRHEDPRRPPRPVTTPGSGDRRRDTIGGCAIVGR